VEREKEMTIGKATEFGISILTLLLIGAVILLLFLSYGIFAVIGYTAYFIVVSLRTIKQVYVVMLVPRAS
jgi:hypothetical protein